MLNSPHNPTGKVFSLAEMEAIAAVVRDNPQINVISDEVYKYTIYNPRGEGDGKGSPIGHHHFARLPGLVCISTVSVEYFKIINSTKRFYP